MIAIIDYGVGNLFSLISSLEHLGVESVVTKDEQVIRNADKIILPGVGAFADAIKLLRQTGLVPLLEEQVASGKPLLGICLGMQLLFERGMEYGDHSGLGFIKGEVCPIADDAPKGLKIPHMGWNALTFKNAKSEIFKYLNEGDFVYFVHSYFAMVEDSNDLSSVTDYTVEITASVQKGNVYGCQFHPEKSGETGLKILKAFNEL